jgi:hypothetical protein
MTFVLFTKEYDHLFIFCVAYNHGELIDICINDFELVKHLRF